MGKVQRIFCNFRRRCIPFYSSLGDALLESFRVDERFFHFRGCIMEFWRIKTFCHLCLIATCPVHKVGEGQDFGVFFNPIPSSSLKKTIPQGSIQLGSRCILQKVPSTSYFSRILFKFLVFFRLKSLNFCRAQFQLASPVLVKLRQP